MNQKKNFEYSQKNLLMVENLRWVPKLLCGIYGTSMTCKDQNQGPAMLVKATTEGPQGSSALSSATSSCVEP